MISDFTDSGCLPPGIHSGTLDEIESRFGKGSEVRRVQFESIRWMVDLARRAAVKRIILNGSFVTDIIEPNDVDCLLLTGDDYPKDVAAADQLDEGLPFLEMKIVRQSDFDEYVNLTFGTDRRGRAKGMIEVVQWI